MDYIQLGEQKFQPPFNSFIPNEGIAATDQNDEQFIGRRQAPNEEQFLLYKNLLNRENPFGLSENLLALTTHENLLARATHENLLVQTAQSLNSISISRPQTPDYRSYSYNSRTTVGDVSDDFVRINTVTGFQTEQLLRIQDANRPLFPSRVPLDPAKGAIRKKSSRKIKKPLSGELQTNTLSRQFMHIFNSLSIQGKGNELPGGANSLYLEGARAEPESSSMQSWQERKFLESNFKGISELMKDSYPISFKEKDRHDIKDRSWKETGGDKGTGTAWNIKASDLEESAGMDNRRANETNFPSEQDSDESSNSFSDATQFKDKLMDFSSFNRTLLHAAGSLNSSLMGEAASINTSPIMEAGTNSASSLVDSAVSSPLKPSAVAISSPLGAEAAAISNRHTVHDVSTSRSDIIARALAATRGPRKPRGEKKPIPHNLKDKRYYERRKRNNIAAKKSRDARKQRESAIASRASVLEAENSVLRRECMALRLKLDLMITNILRKGTLDISYTSLNDLNSLINFNRDFKGPEEEN